MKGKVVVYNSSTGNGLLVMENNEKKDFSINDWLDFNILPEIGLAVEINDDGKIIAKKEINELDNEKKENSEDLIKKLINKKEKYINEMTARGWTLLSNNESGFVLQHQDDFPILKFLLIAVLIGIILVPFLNIFGPIFGIIIGFFISNPKATLLKGTIDKDKLQIELFKDGIKHKTLSLTDEVWSTVDYKKNI
jgi:hypothetical protein